ncbi:synaptosomal-associated protein 25-like isoform X1 [Metopolophium dirhodum]|uniref:synaptosomal-associated protein 25-like isoform X1 n=1 Tax=Metopolophium dirhodum TaxID=44670 RepID=UPI0029901C64|nr:synaptosomal-associated protein 25-like isoform X1 [Metopolophium dirhodum]
MPAIVANELQDMQLRSAHVTDESLESTRRMIELCEGTKEAAIKALVELDDQGEKMDRIEEGMDQINADMKEAEKNLTGMEKCCGICVVPCNKSTSFKEDEGTWKGNEDGKVINKQPQRVIEGPNITPQGGYIVNDTNESMHSCRITNDARETEMDENLGQVNTMIGNLRNMALDMGSELENQNQQIEKISTKTKSNDLRISAANQRTRNLLK